MIIMEFELILWLFGAHYIGDIALQSDMIAKMKRERWYILFAHVMIWTTIVCIPLRLFDALSTWNLIFLFVGHYAADWIKCRSPKEPQYWHYIYYDQAWHLCQLVIVALW